MVHGPIQVTLAQKCNTKVVVCLHKVRFYAKHFCVVIDSFVYLSPVVQNNPKIEVC